jgi:hypothetical protein
MVVSYHISGVRVSIPISSVVDECSEKIWKIRKKSKLNSEMIWKIWKKGKLNSDKTWTIWKKSKLNSEMIWKL